MLYCAQEASSALQTMASAKRIVFVITPEHHKISGNPNLITSVWDKELIYDKSGIPRRNSKRRYLILGVIERPGLRKLIEMRRRRLPLFVIVLLTELDKASGLHQQRRGAARAVLPALVRNKGCGKLALQLHRYAGGGQI